MGPRQRVQGNWWRCWDPAVTTEAATTRPSRTPAQGTRAGAGKPDPAVAAQALASRRPVPLISPAEARVLAILRRGLSNRAIAAELVLSPRTVEDHVSRLLAKTGSQNRCQLMLWEQAQR